MRLVCTLDILDRVVGDHTLDWSADHCIAAATSKGVTLYELNPIKEANWPEMSFNVQVLSSDRRMEYDAGIKEILDDYDTLRSLPSKSAASPDFEIYRTYLEPSWMQLCDGGEGFLAYRAVSFSPLLCASGGGTVLATLAMCHRLQLYSRTSNGTSIQWTVIADLTDILVDVLQRNNNYYPGVEFPKFSKAVHKIWEKQFAAYITCFAWSGTSFCDSLNKKFILFATCTKNNFLIVWKLELPVHKTSNISILNYIKTNIVVCKCVSWLKNESTQQCSIAVGGSDGVVMCFQVDPISGKLIEKYKVWSEKDQLSVSFIDWAEVKIAPGSRLLVSKGGLVLHVRLSSDHHVLFYSSLKGIHMLPITNIERLSENEWVTSSQDGSLVRVWLPETGVSTEQENRLEFEVLTKASLLPQPLFPETCHYAIVSPNRSFLVRICSKPKVAATIQVENSGYVEIKTLSDGISSLNMLLTDHQWCIESNMHPPIDLLESVRLHVVRKELQKSESDVLLFQKMLDNVVESQTTGHLQMKWFILKMLLAINPCSDKSYKLAMEELEKKIVTKQMIKVLKSWFDFHSASSGNKSPPIRSIVEWLHKNENLVAEDDMEFIGRLEKTQKYLKTEMEVCMVTGESLLMSDDARHALTEITNMMWCRCCLTFRALQEHKTRKCGISNARSKLISDSDEGYMKELLQEPSIFSACAMI